MKKTDGINKPNENGKISNLLDPDAEKQTFGRKSQNWPNLRDEMAFFSKYFLYIKYKLIHITKLKYCHTQIHNFEWSSFREVPHY
ncbi:hypothetical protein Hanom_Chr09g00782471 [Helianthus anomalus]